MSAKNSKIDVVSEILRVLRLEGKSIADCADRIQNDSQAAAQLARAVEIFNESLNQGGKIVVTGLGKSGKVGQKIAATLCSTGNLAVYLHPTEGLHGDLGLIGKQDSVLALSYTGNTSELVRLLPSLRKLGVPVVALCGKRDSTLAQEAEVWLDGSVDQEACPHNLAPTASTTLALAIGDALALALMQLRGFDTQAFATYHPGGSIGNRLNLRVADVMHSGNDVGTVGARASMDEVVNVSTQKKLGAILVVDGRKLLGVITDGDIRRALLHKEKFFRLHAEDIMTRRPVMVDANAMAKAALDLMENRPSQIAQIPVVNAAGEWEGLVRLHDLARLF